MAHKGYEIQDLLNDAEEILKFYTDTAAVRSLYDKLQQTPPESIEPYWNEYRTLQLHKMLEAWKELNKYSFFKDEPTSKEIKNRELQRYAGDIERTKDCIEGFCRKHIRDAECKGVLHTLLKLWGEMDRYHKKLLGDIETEPAPAEPKEYDARLMAFYRNDAKTCERFFTELKKVKPLTPDKVKKTFVMFQPDIKKLHKAELARTLTDILKPISDVKITRDNMAEIERYCKDRGIPIATKKKKQD